MLQSDNSNTVRVEVSLWALEPGTHIARKTTERISRVEYSLPVAECAEVRPDWGEYFPIIAHPAIERALRARGAFTALPSDRTYFYGVVKYGPFKPKA